MFRTALALCCFVAVALAAAGPVITFFDVGQAMSSLIIFPSGFSILIDSPETAWESSKTSDLLAPKLEKLLGKRHIDVAVLSHLHLDHIGYASKGGVWKLIEAHGFTFGKIVDRDSGKWVDTNNDGVCTLNEIQWNNVGTTSGTGEKWLCYATDPRNKAVYAAREIARLCATDQIRPPDTLAKVTIVATDGLGAKTKDGKLVSGNHRAEAQPPSENDYSIGLLVQYGGFSFATFGDLDGEYYNGEFGYTYNDVESSVLHRLGGVDLHNVDHHGSEHSSNAAFIAKLKPTVSVISCGANNTFGHPTQKTLNTLLNTGGDIFITENGNPNAQYGRAVVVNGDIVVTVDATGKSFDVQAGKTKRTYATKNTQHPNCTL